MSLRLSGRGPSICHLIHTESQGSAKYVMKNKQLNKNSGVLGFFVLKTGDGHMRIKSGVL